MWTRKRGQARRKFDAAQCHDDRFVACPQGRLGRTSDSRRVADIALAATSNRPTQRIGT